MNVLIQAGFSQIVPALAGTAFNQFSQIGIDIGSWRDEAHIGPGTGMDFPGVVTA
jgi:hypothetical protein